MAGHVTYNGDLLLCRKCKKRPLAKPSGYPKHCKDCINASLRKWRKANPEKCHLYKVRQDDRASAEGKVPWHVANPDRDRDNKRKNKLLTKFGLTPECYQRMLNKQNGGCAICKRKDNGTRNGRPRHFAVDHCHSTGAVRGLLCSNCNWAIGHLRDSIELMQAAIEYINRAKTGAESKRS